ncbi:TetR/AcrR family transcriptional regulator [Burkholderia pyrrocinia]|uniref:TetR/AcrR family transcriptional regulator n=1 Tax=Burkholderia pyrrocinia TaxID=60550 RepID=UPI0030CB547D
MTRVESRERTRQRVLDAAALSIAKRGLAAISVEEIAAHAGYTRGAFYSNFRSKGDLFVELLRLDHGKFCENMQSMIDGAPSNEDVQKQFASWLDQCYRDDKHYFLWAEARLHAARDVKFRLHLSAMCAEKCDMIARFIAQLCNGAKMILAGDSLADHALAAMVMMDGVGHFKQVMRGEVSNAPVDVMLTESFASMFFRTYSE